MNIVQAFEKQEEILKHDNEVICSKCGKRFFSPSDKMYISVKGSCYVCDEDELLADNILKNI